LKKGLNLNERRKTINEEPALKKRSAEQKESLGGGVNDDENRPPLTPP
jgi:hypothetical protein